LRLFSFGVYGLALAALALMVFGAIECPPNPFVWHKMFFLAVKKNLAAYYFVVQENMFLASEIIPVGVTTFKANVRVFVLPPTTRAAQCISIEVSPDSERP